jgi:Carboxypeptidase regulatory-like domain
MSKLYLLIPFTFIFGFCVCHAKAQSSSSLIVSVSDPNGSIVAAADSELTADNFKQNAVSSDLGVISYRGLRPGKYQLTITVNGFKPYKNVSIEIAAGETKRLDVILELSVIEDTVDVSQSEAVDATTSGTDRPRRVKTCLAGPRRPHHYR